jgi:L-threonylcarbamoyladenylate synthase
MGALKLNKKDWQKVFEKTKKAIKMGKVLVCPTDTVYGLVADATNQKAVDKIFKIKKRSKNKPIPVFVRDLKMAKQIAKVNRKQERFLKSIWPGKVTVVLRPKIRLARGIGNPPKEIGLRIPRYKIINRLQAKLNLPLTSTSANISGRPPSTKIREVISQFRGQRFKPDLVIDSGDLAKNKPSMIIDLTVDKPRTLRV